MKLKCYPTKGEVGKRKPKYKKRLTDEGIVFVPSAPELIPQVIWGKRKKKKKEKKKKLSELPLISTLEEIGPKVLGDLEAVKRASNKELLFSHLLMHQWYLKDIREEENRMGWNIERIWNMHQFIAEELIRRDLKHDTPLPGFVKRKMSNLSKDFFAELADKVLLKEFIDLLPNKIPIKKCPGRIFVCGGLVNRGWCTEQDIDILVKQNKLDFRPINYLKKKLPKGFGKKLHAVFDKDGPLIGHAILIYKKGIKTQTLDKAQKSVKPMKPKRSEKIRKVYLKPCPHFENPEKCVLAGRFEFKLSESSYKEELVFPIKCHLAKKYKCQYVKDYYYKFRRVKHG